MALPVVIPNTFANANASIPLSQLDNNFSTVAVAINGMANGAESLSNVNITGGSIANASLSNVSISSGNVTINVANVTTLDATNVEVTNIKAKDGTASATIADSTGVMTIGSSVLTTTDINGGTIDNTSIGATTPNTGAFTTLTTSSTVTLNGGTANGVAYLNGSKVLTTGSALVFDGTSLGVGTSSPSSKLQVANGALTISDATTHAFLKISPNSGSAAFLDIPTVGSSLLIRTSASSTTDTNAVAVTSSGNVGIGTSSPSAARLHVVGVSGGYVQKLNNVNSTRTWAFGVDKVSTNDGIFVIDDVTAGANRLAIDTSGNVLIGSPTYTRRLSVKDTTNTVVVIEGSNSGSSNINFADSDSENPGSINYSHSTNYMAFQTAGAERARIDSSGNLLIGGTTSYGKLTTYVGNNSRFAATTSSGSGGGAGGWQLPAYYGSVKVNYIDCELTDGTGGSEASVMRFATIGSGTLAERMRIDASGAVLAGTTSASISSSGLKYEGANGALLMVRDGNTPFAINRLTNDGNLIEFYQATSLEGTISVSGTTVSYNGGHLSRWSQTTDNTRIPLVKGTVMSNLDQMANWDGQANEQLNCMKVSDVEGDVNVAGVFVNWDNDDDEFTNDMNIAMTGDMIIRIAQGTVVQRGDLLMSAGDGTAKPQGDDIVRSKTVAKVTSTHITCTYDDGSYCVPCVLMAC